MPVVSGHMTTINEGILKMRFKALITATGSFAVGAAMLVGGAGMAFAQDSTNASTAAPSHPAFIESGECSNLDANPVATLNDVTTHVNGDGNAKDNPVKGTLTATTVLYSKSDSLDLKWDDMLSQADAITVHDSQSNIKSYLACGVIGGVVVDDSLAIALEPMNNSGYSGIALLKKDDGGKVDVEIYLAEPTKTGPNATPAS